MQADDPGDEAGDRSLTAEYITGLVDAELTQADPAIAARIRRFLVEPHCVVRHWDYGPAMYLCWMVLEHPASGTGIAYCQHGFGPERPWGLLWLMDNDTGMGPGSSMGQDSSWFESLGEAFLDSFAALEAPSGEG